MYIETACIPKEHLTGVRTRAKTMLEEELCPRDGTASTPEEIEYARKINAIYTEAIHSFYLLNIEEQEVLEAFTSGFKKAFLESTGTDMDASYTYRMQECLAQILEKAGLEIVIRLYVEYTNTLNTEKYPMLLVMLFNLRDTNRETIRDILFPVGLTGKDMVWNA